MKHALKIKLETEAAFKQAWNALIALGYYCPKDLTPNSATHVYAYADGLIRSEFIEDVDQSSIDYFNSIEHKEVTLDELIAFAEQHKSENDKLHVQLLKQERPLFEANYVKNGGDLHFLKWSETHDGAGDYQPDWEKLAELNHVSFPEENAHIDKVTAHGEHVLSCLMSWVECAKSKAIPDGYYLMPIQPDIEMLKMAELEFDDLDISDIQDRIVFSHQAMIQVLCQST